MLKRQYDYNPETVSVKYAVNQLKLELDRVYSLLSRMMNDSGEPYSQNVPTLTRNSVLYALLDSEGKISDKVIVQNISDPTQYYFFASSTQPVLLSFANGIDESGRPQDIQRTINEANYTAWINLPDAETLYLTIDYVPSSDSIQFSYSSKKPLYAYGAPENQSGATNGDLYFDLSLSQLYEYSNYAWNKVYRIFVAERTRTSTDPLEYSLERYTLDSVSKKEQSKLDILEKLVDERGIIDFGSRTVKASVFDGVAKYVPEQDIGGNFWLVNPDD